MSLNEVSREQGGGRESQEVFRLWDIRIFEMPDMMVLFFHTYIA